MAALPAVFETVTDLHRGTDALRRRRYGAIEARDGRLHGVRLRPFPKIVSAPDVLLLGRWRHEHGRGDRVRVYYNQPWRSPGFLVLAYILSARDATYATCCRALHVLDEIARIKGSDALLCDVASSEISDRVLARWGWEPHCASRWHRHYIKRFYGTYPPPLAWPPD